MDQGRLDRSGTMATLVRSKVRSWHPGGDAGDMPPSRHDDRAGRVRRRLHK
jgi:hypothetical protein